MSAPYRYEVWVEGCIKCGSRFLAAASTQSEAVMLKNSANLGTCGGKAVIRDLGEQK